MFRLKLMTDTEKEALVTRTKNLWASANTASIERSIWFNKRFIQQCNTRLVVLEEILNDRNTDNKSKQYVD